MAVQNIKAVIFLRRWKIQRNLLLTASTKSYTRYQRCVQNVWPRMTSKRDSRFFCDRPSLNLSLGHVNCHKKHHMKQTTACTYSLSVEIYSSIARFPCYSTVLLLYKAQYTPSTPTRRNCRVESRRRCEHNSQLAHDCRRIRSTIWKLTKLTIVFWRQFWSISCW